MVRVFNGSMTMSKIQPFVLPKDLQQPDDSHEFQPTPNGTPYWVPDVPEDEKPKEGDLAADTNFRKDFHKLVWNVYIGPDVFEQRWNDMISRYNLHDNKWLSIICIRERWVPGFFKDVPMCGLMKQLRDQRVLMRFSRYIHMKVVFNKKAGSFTCSCGHYNRHGFLCRHVFCVFRIYGIHKIPDVYLNRRWTKNVLPAHLLDKRHRYGPCIEETDTLASQVHQNIEECIGLFRNDTDKLSELLSTVQDLKKKAMKKRNAKQPHLAPNKDGTRRIKSAVEKGKAKTIARTYRKVPFKRRTCSACGGKGHNKATCEGCSACGEPGHHKGICKKFPNQDKGGWSGKKVVDVEDEGDTDDQFDDEALCATEDEFGEDDEVDERIRNAPKNKPFSVTRDKYLPVHSL
ncbi:FAR1 DNA binding domain-containing protein [Tanacetum coccineum]